MKSSSISNHQSSCFNFVDFCPQHQWQTQTWFALRRYQTLSELFQKINSWLCHHRYWRAVSCESIYYDPSNGFGNEISSVSGGLSRKTVKGIRLWLVPSDKFPNFERPQTLNCLNLVPRTATNQNNSNERISQNTDSTIFTDLDSVQKTIEHLNELVDQKVINGTIISIETVPLAVSRNYDVNVQSSEHLSDATEYVQSLRIYYESSRKPCAQHANIKIGLKDFVPSSITWDSPLAPPNYESFASLFTRASQWLREQSCEVNFLNCQSVELPIKKEGCSKDCSIETDKSLFTTQGAEFNLRFIRIAFTMPKDYQIDSVASLSSLKSNETILNCKIFVPSRLKTSFRFESVAATRRKMEAWLTITGAKVLSAETSFVKLSYFSSSVAANVDSCLTSLWSKKSGGQWIVIYRVYIDGYYIEPPSRLLPSFKQEEESDETSCSIS